MSDKKKTTPKDSNFTKQIQEILFLTVTEKTTEKNVSQILTKIQIEKGKKMLQALESQYDFNQIYKEVSRQLEQDMDKYDEEHAMNLIKYLENQQNENLQKDKINEQPEITLTPEEEQLISKVYKDYGETFKDVFLSIPISIQKEIALQLDSMIFLKTYAKIEQLKTQFKMCGGIQKLSIILDKKFNKITRKTLNYLKMLYFPQSSTVFDRIIKRIQTEVFYQIIISGQKRLNKFQKFIKIMENTNRLIRIKQMNVLLKKLSSKRFKYEQLFKNSVFIEKLENQNILFGWKKIKENYIQQRKKKLPVFLVNVKTMYQNNKKKQYLSIWRDHTTRKNQFLIRLMVNVFQEKCNGILKNSIYKIFDIGVTQPRKDISKINMKVKGRILESVTKTKCSIDRNAAFSRWKVKCNKDHLQKAVKGIAMHSKMNPQILLWRLKHLLPKFQIKRVTKFKRRNVAILVTIHKYQMLRYARLKYGWNKIYHKNNFGKPEQNRLYQKVHFLMNLFNKKNYKYAFEMIKLREFYMLENKDNFHIAADILNAILERKFRIILKNKLDIWTDANRENQLKIKFFTMILKTKMYSMIKLIMKWKKIPDIRYEQFQENSLNMVNFLQIYARKKIFSTFSVLLGQLTEGDNTKLKILTEIQENGIQKNIKLFYLWANETLKHKQIKKCRQVTQFLESIQQTLVNNSSLLFERDRTRVLKTEALDRMMGKFRLGLLKLFQLWSRKAKFESLKNNQVKNLIGLIKNFMKQSENQQILDTYKKFHKNSRIFKIMQSFYESLLDTKVGQAYKLVLLMKGLPEKLNKNNGNKFQSRLQYYCQKKLDQNSMKSFKDNLSDGNAIKGNNLANLFYLTMNNQKRLFLSWRNRVVQIRILNKCKKTTQFLDDLEKQILVNTQLIFVSTRELDLKKNAIQKLLDNCSSKIRTILKKWQQNSRQKKMEEDLLSGAISQEQKEKIKNLIMSISQSQKSYLRKILQQFYANSIIKKRMLGFYKGCLDLSFGRIFKAFFMFKNLPNRIDHSHLDKCNAFERELRKYSHNKILLGFSPLKNIFIEASQKKQQSLLYLVKKTESGISKSFGMWVTSLRRFKAIKQCQLVQSLYDVITSTIQTNLFDFLQDRNYDIKVKAIQMLILKFENNLRASFLKYKHQVHKKIVQTSLNTNSKQQFLGLLNKFLQNNGAQQLRIVLIKFRHNSMKQKIIQLLFKKLSASKMGILYNIFQKMISMPERPDFEKMSKCSKLQLALQGILSSNIKQFSWNQLSENYDQGESFKQYVVVRFIRSTIGQNKSYLYKWRFKVGLENERSRIRYGINLFHTLNWQINLSQSMIHENSRETKIKEQVILKLLFQGTNKLRRFFMQWNHNGKMNKIAGAIQDKEREMFIRALGIFHHNNNKTQLRQVLDKFSRYHMNLSIREKIMRTMLHSTNGKVGIVFQIWKVLPEKRNQNALDNCNKFSSKLNKLYLLKLNQTFKPLKQAYLNCQNLKIRLILGLSFKNQSKNDQNLTIVLYKMAKNRLNDTAEKRQSEKSKFQVQFFQKKIYNLSHLSIRRSFQQFLDLNYQAIQERKNTVKIIAIVTMNKQQKFFQRWEQFTKKQQTIECVQKTIGFFSQLNLVIRTNTDLVFKNDSEMIIKSQIFNKMIDRMKTKLNFGFIKWNQFTKISRINEQMSQNEKTQMVKALFGFQKNSLKSQLREILRLFAINKSLQKRTKDVFFRLLNMGQGRIYSVFKLWKILPNRVDDQQKQNANTLEATLNRLQKRKFQLVKGALKECGSQGDSKKIQIIRQFIHATESKQLQFFHNWKKFTDETKILERSKSTLDFFANLNVNFSGKFSVINDSLNNLQNQLKTQVLDKMLYIKSRDIQSLFKLWNMKAQFLKIDDGNLQVVKNLLIDRLKLFLNNTEKSKFRHAMSQLFTNSRIQKKIIKTYNNLLSTSVGKTQDLFNRWKALPENLKNKQSKTFYTVALRIARSGVKNSFDALKSEFYLGFGAKQESVKYLSNKTHGKLKQSIRMWTKSTKINNITDRCTLLSNFMQDINKLLKLKFINSFYNIDQHKFDLQVDVINRLLAFATPRMQKYLHRWKKQCRVHKIQKQLSKKNKEYFINSLIRYQNRGDKIELRKVLYKFRRFTQLQKYNCQIVDKMFQTRFGRANTLFILWKGLPTRAIDSDEDQDVGEEETQQQKDAKKLYNAMTRRLKNSLKKLCEINFQACNQQKKILNRWLFRIKKPEDKAMIKWKNQARNLKLFENIVKIDSTFTMLNNQIQQNFQVILDSERATKIKQQAIQLMLTNSRNSLSQVLKRWLFQGKMKGICQQIDNSQKEYFLDKLHFFIKSSNQEKIRMVLKKFENNKNIEKIKNLVFGRMMSTRDGMLMNRLLKWKILPERRDFSLEAKTNSFENKLARMIHLYIRKQSFDKLQQQSNDGINAKKDAVIYFIQKTQSKYGKFVTLWRKRVKSDREVLKFRETQNFIHFLNLAIKDSMSIISDSRNSKIKDRVIMKIFRFQGFHLETSFKKWRETSRILSVQIELDKKMSDEQKKKLINVLTQAMNSKKEVKTRNIFNQFHLALKMDLIKRNIFKKLLYTNYGQISKAIDNWKTIPVKKKTLIINQFEFGLMKFVDRRLRLCLNRVLDQSANGYNQKQRSILSFIEKTMSKQKLMFIRWTHITQRVRILNQCEKTIEIFSRINEVQRNNLLIVFRNQQEIAVMNRALEVLFHTRILSMERSFKIWMYFNRIKKLQSQFDDEKKKKFIKSLNLFTKNSQNEKQRKILEQFYLSFKLRKIQFSFFNSILHNSLIMGKRLVGVMKNLPNRINYDNINRTNSFAFKLLTIHNRGLSLTFSRLKSELLNGSNIKQNNMQIAFFKQINQEKDMFFNWKNQSLTQKCYRQSNQLFSFFTTINQQLIKNVIEPVKAQEQNTIVKNQALEKMYRNFLNRLKDKFLKWRYDNQQAKIQEQLQNHKENQMLVALMGKIKNNSKIHLQSVLYKFEKNSKIIKIQTRFINFLLGLSAGKAHIFLDKCKQIPLRRDDEKQKRCNAFQQGLDKSYRKLLLFSLQVLGREQTDGTIAKNRCITSLINMTVGKNKYLFQTWRQMTFAAKQLEKAQNVINIFDLLNNQIAQQVSFPLLKIEKNEDQIKTQAILKMMENTGTNMFRLLQLWKQKIKEQKFNEKLGDKNREFTIYKLTKFLKSSNNIKLIGILKKFDINSNLRKIQMKYFKHSMNSLSGRVQKVFDSWKSIPQIKDYDQINAINVYEKKIIQVFGKKLKAPFRRFLDIKLEGDSLKQRMTSLLVYISSSDLKKSMIRWKNNTEMHKQTIKIQKTINFFSRINEMTSNPIFRSIFLSENQKQIMQLAIQQMLENSRQKLRRNLVVWLQKAKERKIASQVDDQQKKRILLFLAQAMKQNTSQDLRRILRKFLKNSDIVNIMKRVFYTFINTGVGATSKGFHIWKNLPNKRDDAKFNQANSFELKLHRIGTKGVMSIFRKFKNIKFDGESLQQRMALLMVERSQGKFKTLFLRWQQSAQRIKTIAICKATVNFIQQTQNILHSNLFEILIERKNQQAIIAALKRMANNTTVKKGKALERWRQQVGAQRILEQLSDKGKDQALKAFIKFMKNNDHIFLRQILKKFSLNADQQITIGLYMNKIMNNKLGHCFKLFNIWKNLPEKFSSAAANQKSIFEQKLSFIIKKKISRSTFNNLLNDNAKASVTKKLMCNTIIVETRGIFHKMFLKWNNQAKTQKRIRMAKVASNFIHDLSKILQKNIIENLGGAQQQSVKKSNKHFALRAIVRNSYNQKHFAMQIWKQDFEIANSKSKFASKFIIVNILNNLHHERLMQGLFHIEKKRQILIIKSATNSLWKWKLSQVEAKYAKRFRLLYQQTQFLLSFLAFFEKKRQDTLHYSLGKIKLQLLNDEVLSKLFGIAGRYKKRTVDYNFYKWRSLSREMKLAQEHDELKRNQFGNNCLDVIQKIIARREQWSLDLILKEANLNQLNNYVSSTDYMIKFYLSRLRFGMKKIKKRSQHKQQAYRAFNFLRHMIMKRTATIFFTKYRENKSTDLRALQIYNLLTSYQKQQYRAAFDKLKRSILLIRNFVAICQKFQDNQLRYAIVLKKQFIQAQIIKIKTQSLLKFTKLNVWREKRLMDEATKIWKNSIQYVEILSNAWSKKVPQYLAKNVKINPQISFWRLKDYALALDALDKKKYESSIHDPNFSRIIDNNNQSRMLSNVQDSAAGQLLQGLDRNSQNFQLQEIKQKLHNLNSVFKRLLSKNLMKSFHGMKLFKSNIFLGAYDDVKNPLSSNSMSPMPASPKRAGKETPQFTGVQPRFAVSIIQNPKEKQEQIENQNQKIKQLMLILKSIHKKKKFQVFTTIKFVIRRRKKQAQDDESDVQEKQQIIEKDNELMKEINNIKQSNDLIKNELKEKESELQEAFESISVLHSRLNYMITDRVVDILDKFREGLLYHALRKLQDDD